LGEGNKILTPTTVFLRIVTTVVPPIVNMRHAPIIAVR